MSGAGISPLAFYDPDLYAKQQAISRQQGFGQALLQQGAQGGDYRQPYSGLAAMGNELLGAYLLKRGDKKFAQLYGAGDNAGPTPAAMPTSAAPSPTGAALSAPTSGVQPPTSSPVQSSAPAPIPQAQGGGSALPPAVARIYENPAFPRIPGVDPSTAIQALLQGGPAWQAYMTAYYTSVQPTPEQKNALAATGGDPEATRRLLFGKANKDATLAGRPNGILWNQATGQMVGIPGPGGTVPVQQPNGTLGLQMAPNAASAVAQSGYAQAAPRAMFTPQTGYDRQNQPVRSNQAVMSGQGAAANNLVFGNPNGPQGGPPPGQPLTPAPTPGLPVTGAGPQIPAPAGDIGPGNMPKAPPGVVPAAPPAAPAPANGPLAPALGPGVSTYYEKQYGPAGDNVQRTIEEAAEGGGTATRINVLQNIQHLLSLGAQTGSPEWLQSARDAAAGLSQALGHPVDANSQAALMGEVKKFMAQYAARAAQSVGADTDASRELSNIANPHAELYPATLTRMIPWIMANERGIQAKANAQTAYLNQNGNSPQAAQAFEAFWRNNYSPRVAQFEQMSPDQKLGYLHDHNAFPTQDSIRTFQRQYKTLHPFFTVPQ